MLFLNNITNNITDPYLQAYPNISKKKFKLFKGNNVNKDKRPNTQLNTRMYLVSVLKPVLSLEEL